MKILNISYSLPSLKVSNQVLIKEILDRSKTNLTLHELGKLETRIKRFFRMSGTETRYHRNIGERALDFALSAGKKALAKAGVKPEDVDLLIYAGVGRGWVEPATANLFQSELGLSGATCFDVLDACASWIRSLSIAESFINSAAYKVIMILNCEFNFREYANFELQRMDEIDNSFSAFTIGEAATATLVTADHAKIAGDEDTHFSFRTFGDKHELCKIALPNAEDFSPSNGNGNGHHVKPMTFMTAPAELFSFTIGKLVDHFKETPLVGKKFDLIVGHSVSSTATTKVAQLVGLSTDKVFETHQRFGNTVSATLPLGLAVAEAEGRLQRGMDVLLIMGSAGVTTGLCAFRY